MPTANEQLRVLIVRLGAMGDILHAMPAVTALRQAHPEWFLGWAMEPRWQALFRDAHGQMPLVDRVHLVNAKAWAHAPFSRETLRQIGETRRELRGEHYDVSVDLQGAVRSAILARVSRSARIIGEKSPREPAARWFFRERVPTRGVHVIEQATEVCGAIMGEKLEPVLPSVPADPDAEAWAQQLVDGNAAPLVLISPGAGWGAKRWPAERYGVVASGLGARGCRVLVNAAPEESAIAAETVEASGGVAETRELTLERLIAVVRRAHLVIAGDTGPLHLACALAKPVVGIFGPTDPARNGPFGVPFRVLRHPHSKRDHTRRSQPEAGLLTITAEQVLNAAMELLEERPGGAEVGGSSHV